MMLSCLCLGNTDSLVFVLPFLFMLICMACSSQALFPGNEVAEIYHEMARKVTLFYSVYFVVY